MDIAAIQNYSNYLQKNMEFILEISSREDMIHDINTLMQYIDNELMFIIEKWDDEYVKKATLWDEEEKNIIDAFVKLSSEIQTQLNAEDRIAELIDRCTQSHDHKYFFQFQEELYSKLNDPFSVIKTLTEYEPDKISSSDKYSDTSLSKKIADVVTWIYNAILDMKKESTLDLIEDDMIKLIRTRITDQEKWFKDRFNFKRVHPYSSYLYLKSYCDFINPNFEQFSWDNRDFFGRMLHKEFVDEIAYYRELDLKNRDEFWIKRIEKEFAKLKYQLKRFVKGIIQELNHPILINQILERYKLRTVLYNTNHLKDMVELAKQNERMLTRDLCNFLFDQGYTPINEFQLDVGRIDVADLSGNNPFILEVKLIDQNFSKNNFMSAIRQIVSYLTSIEKSFTVSQGYLVFFRLGGPLISIPDVILIHNTEVYFKIIDISGEAPSDRKLNKGLKKIQITEQEIRDEFEMKLN